MLGLVGLYEPIRCNVVVVLRISTSGDRREFLRVVRKHGSRPVPKRGVIVGRRYYWGRIGK
jgi:hypothetical protein